MTYLQAINHVMRRLREDEVSTWDETTYSKMVGDLVNDAMIKVQQAHNWSQLVTELDVDTVASTQTVTLDGVGEGAQVWQVLNSSTKSYITSRDRGWMRMQTSLAGTPEGPPSFFAFSSQATDGDPLLQFYPIPDGVYALKILVKKQQARMDDDADVILVPDDPVVQLATAYAFEERGDTGGQNNMTQFQRANESLADAIGLDYQRDPTLLTWTEH